MAESQRLRKINESIARMRRLGEEYDVAPPAAATTVPVTPVTPVVPKKKKKGTISSVIGKIRGFLTPKPQTGITPPSGYAGMTPAQKKEWQSIMEQTK